MIPKKIHYTWIWWKEMPNSAKKCIESRKKYLPDYELCLWNEENFDINSNSYVKAAYEAKKFAFVRDYIRIRAMYTYWWISMDTDVEVLKNLDKFLGSKWFSWFEDRDLIPTWIMASEQWNPFIWEILDWYKVNEFDPNNLVTNVIIITNIAKEKYWFKWWCNELVKLKNDVYEFYPKSYFCPISYLKPTYNRRNLIKDKDCYTIHHFAWSWTWKTKLMRFVENWLYKLLKKVHIYNFIRNIYIKYIK